jgi:hypothetical protein
MAAMSAAEAAAYAASRRRIFFIAGHGMETPGTFQLSGECEVVVKKNTCEVAFESEFHHAMEGLLSLPEEMARHPIRYRDQITQRMGSVMVYSRNHRRINGMEGSCVNFMYQLMMMHFREDARGNHVEIHFDMGSGIIDLARWKAARTYVGPPRIVIVRQRLPGMGPTAFHDTAENIQLIGGLYEHSIFPTMEFVETYLGIKWKEKEVELYDMLDDLRKQRFMNVTQETLCKHVAGVYYHMICRSMAPHVTPNIKEYVAQWKNWKKGNAPMNVRKIVSNPVVDRRFFRELRLRRDAYDRYYHSTPFQEKQHATNMANCRNLEASMTTLDGLLHAVNATNATNAVKQKEKEKIQRRIRFFRTIRNNKHVNCAHREENAQRANAQRAQAQRAHAHMEEAHQAALRAAQRTAQREAQRQAIEDPAQGAQAQMEEAHQAALRAAQRTAHREAQRQAKETQGAEETDQRSHSRSRSRSPTRHSSSQTHKKSQNRGNNRGNNKGKNRNRGKKT